MAEQKTLQKMDDNEFLGKVDALFEWLARQAGEGPIENWTLQGIQTEIRRRIMEGRAAVVVEPEPEKIKVAVRSIRLRPEPPVDTPFLINAVAYCISLRNQKIAVKDSFLAPQEVRAYLRGVRAIQSFGLQFEEIPEFPPDI